jgi:hypothetical protein
MKRSESISSLAKALAIFNSKVSKVSKDANNPFFRNKYATLDNIIDEVRPILTENGLTLMQFPSGDGNLVSVSTYLMHESGEWIESDPLIMKPVKNDPQAIGSCITYARRYSLASFLSLNTGEDDDGNKATHPNGIPQGNTSRNGANKNGANSNIPMATKKQMDTVHKLVNEIADVKAITKEAAYQILQKYMKKDMDWYTEDDAGKAIQMLNKSLQQGA